MNLLGFPVQLQFEFVDSLESFEHLESLEFLELFKLFFMSSSYDFVDLDEEEFMELKKFPYFPSSTSPVSPISHVSPVPLASSSIFIRSASPDSIEEGKAEVIIVPESSDFAFKIILNDTRPCILRFNPLGPNHEGRDSKVFRGSLQFDSQLLNLPVAVKVYKNENDSLAGAQKEIKIATEILQDGRPDFLKLYFAGALNDTENDEYFVSVWEWIEGGTLEKMVRNLSLEQVKSCIQRITYAISFLHSKHLAHHDLKPQNILLTPDASRIILIDFGDSKHLSHFDNFFKCRIPLDEGIGLGTLAYTAPELLSRKSDTYDPFATDVYSYGVLLFYLLNRGRVLPFAALIPHRAVQLILTVQKGFFAGGYNPESPRDSPLYDLMLACLQVDPNKRPTFTEIQDILKLSE